MINKTFKILEYNKIKTMLANKCVSEIGREFAENLRPFFDASSVELALAQTNQAEKYILSVGKSPIITFENIMPCLTRASLGSVLNMAELLKVASFIHNVLYARKTLSKSEYNIIPNSIYAMAASLHDNYGIQSEIERCIISSDEMHDNASSELAEIRRSIRRSNEKIREKLNNYLRNPDSVKLLQEPIITMRGERYVLPVKCEHKSSISGIVHDQSSSGATLFIEPTAVVELNNELRLLTIKEKEEIEKVLARLSNMVELVCNDILADYKLMGLLDFAFAKAKLSREMNATEPRINNSLYINIRNGRHPLIDNNKVVPCNVWLGDAFSVLLITGPNTGGKTVTLKTIGLFQLMAQSGLNLPCDYGSEVAIFDGIYADIGDEQSIEQSLSTFSSHMTNIAQIMNVVSSRSLVLFDELGAGTDPNEGASLAIAILEKLINIGARVAATTHYSELKAYSFTNQHIENASVEFDSNTLKPTYKLSVGIPGASNAFLISKRLGLDDSIVNRAAELMDGEQVRFESVLQKAQEHKRLAEIEKLKAEQIRQETESIKLETQKLNAELKAKENEIIKRANAQAKKILENADKEAEKYISELKELKDKCNDDSLIKMQKLRKGYKAGLVEEQRVIADDNHLQINRADIVPGATVYIKSLAQNAIVRSLPNNKDEVKIQAGIIQMNVKISDIAKVEEKSNKVAGRVKIEKSASTVSLSIDVRGKTVDEAMLEIDRYLEEAAYAGYKEVTIIHGKGTGALRQGIQKELKLHPKVKSQRAGRYGEGEMGVTVVEIK